MILPFALVVSLEKSCTFRKRKWLVGRTTIQAWVAVSPPD